MSHSHDHQPSEARRQPSHMSGLCGVPPFRPTTETVEAGPGVSLALGGTPAATAAAQHAAWRGR